MADTWSPDQYARFREERAQPFFDLLALVQPPGTGRAVDLGCGTGELTRELHLRLGLGETLGIDRSASMLSESARFAAPGLHFEVGDIGQFSGGPYDLIFSNAALQWLDDHPALFQRLAAQLSPGGQLAVQMPANHDHPSHTIAREVAGEEPFRTELKGYARQSPVLAPEQYAELLEQLGFSAQQVRLQVYGHHLDGPEAVIEWVKGTLLTDYAQRLSPASYAAFLARYRERLLQVLPSRRPYFYAFKRLLLWARR